MSISDRFRDAQNGSRVAIAQLLSVIERGGPESRALGALAFPLTGGAHTVGITGAPGAGKSTLTSSLLEVIRSKNVSPAVLAIDPSSPFTGGAILGDRVRMQAHATDPEVFIRSMASRGHLGGLSLATPQAVRFLDAIGKRVVIIETVGVGQVEVDIAGAADTTVVVVNPGWGDGVQANKAGLMEIADIFVINKADRSGVEETQRDLLQMLELSSLKNHVGWTPPIVATVGPSGQGVPALWVAITAHREHLVSTGLGAVRRETRLRDEVRSIVLHALMARVDARLDTDFARDAIADVVNRQLDPWSAADSLLVDARE